MKRLIFTCLTIALFAPAAMALWVAPDDKIPAARLIENLETQLAAAPDDPHILARLGRIHSLRYSVGDGEVDVIRDAKTSGMLLYEHGNGYPSARHSLEEDAIATRIGDLHKALEYYERAVVADPDEAYIWLGLGYTRDEMSHAAAYLAWPSGEDGDSIRDAVRTAWENEALEAYSKAMGRDPAIKGGFLTPPVELEAARYIKEILTDRVGKTRSQKSLLKTATTLSEQAALMPRMVTPIIFSLEEDRSLQSLLAQDTVVSFDLDGTQSGREWPWVKPDTALLVWDGDGRGDVPSGRQLIGSVTWWLFWEHGYAVLKALDDDGDGWLRGAELTGLAAWQDRNSNGVSDPGEVKPLGALGVRGIGVEVSGHVAGMPMNDRGIEFDDGRQLATYDWIVSPLK